MLSIALIEDLHPIAHIFAISIILFLAISCGAAVSTSAGAVLSLAVGLTTPFCAQTVCAYTLSSLFSGMVRRFGRLSVSGMFAACTFVTIWLLFPEANGLLTVSYVAAACIILFFIPDKILLSFGAAATTQISRSDFRTGETVTDAFNKMINTIDSITDIFHDIQSSGACGALSGFAQVYDSTAQAVCADCSLCRFCWHKEKEKTVSLLNSITKSADTKSAISQKDIPEEFSRMCIRTESFWSELNKNIESFKLTKMGAGKVEESKRLVAEQFKNTSLLLCDLQENLERRLSPNRRIEEKIISALDKKGISAERISLFSDDGFYIELHHPVTRNDACTFDGTDELLSDVLGVPMIQDLSDASVFKFYQKPEYSMEIAKASMSKVKNEVCGDCIDYFTISPGKVAIILSDGMGSGREANFQSNLVTALAKKLLCAGIKSETCVRFINSILMTNAQRETFATVDLCVVNLYSGIMEFVKTGAAPSYIKKSKEDVEIHSSSLPAGLIPVVDSDFCIKYAESGDVVVLATDGITDSLDTEKKNGIFSKVSQEISAEENAGKLLKSALSASGGVATDDMTVCVFKIQKI